MVYLELEALGIQNVKTRLSVSYVDHNTLQTGFENADDHLYLQTVASKHGVLFSKPGNGICHQVHLERFTVPGETLLGSDSHTPTAGGAAMLAIGAGGLDVAVAMAGRPFYLTMPKVIGMRLNGKLKPWTCAKDVALEVLRRFGVRGGFGRALEYGGDGLRNLSVPERANIANMGAETGATTSIFPSDQMTLDFLNLQQREHDWKPLCPDGDAIYDEIVEIELEQLEPLVAKPHSPDNIARVSDLEGMKIDQVAIGSCTNSSLEDLMTVASLLKGRRVHPDVSLVISPGSRQVLLEITRNGALTSLLEAGARVLEPACGPCIGMGQAPPSGGVSIRTFNRNFVGRSGTQDAEVYLVGPQAAAVSAMAGVLTDPRKVEPVPKIHLPPIVSIDDSMIIKPANNPETVPVVRGKNIRPVPIRNGLPRDLAGEVLIKVGDNVTTDHIMPAGPKIMALRSNVEAIAEHVFESVDPTFVKRAKERKGGLIVGGENYGQGSSREHAAMAPMYLGVTAVIAKSFARIHQTNLVNFGIVPLSFKDPQDYEETHQGDRIRIDDIRGTLQAGGTTLSCRNMTSETEFIVTCSLPPRLATVLVDGGLLNHTRLMGVKSR
jgi:aconitate hydratase